MRRWQVHERADAPAPYEHLHTDLLSRLPWVGVEDALESIKQTREATKLNQKKESLHAPQVTRMIEVGPCTFIFARV